MPRPRLHEVGASSCAAALRRASTAMLRLRAVHSAMHSSQVPEVTSRRYSLPTCAMRVRIRVFAALRAPYFVASTVSASPCITVGSPEPNCATVAASMFSPSHSSVVGSRVGHSGEGGERKLRSHREILISARTDKKIR